MIEKILFGMQNMKANWNQMPEEYKKLYSNTQNINQNVIQNDDLNEIK